MTTTPFNETVHPREGNGKFAVKPAAEAAELDLMSPAAAAIYAPREPSPEQAARGYDWRGLSPAQAEVRDHADAIKAETDPDQIRADYDYVTTDPDPRDRAHEALIAIAQNPNTPTDVLDDMVVLNHDTPRAARDVARRMGGYVKGWAGSTVDEIRASIRTLPNGETVQVEEKPVKALEGYEIDDTHNDETLYVSKVTNQRDGRTRLDLVVMERGKESGAKTRVSRTYEPQATLDNVVVKRGLPPNPPIIHAGRVVRANAQGELQ